MNRQGSIVDALVRELDRDRPADGAPAGARAAWLSREAAVLDQIADREANPARAEQVRADAARARESARVLGLGHTEQMQLVMGSGQVAAAGSELVGVRELVDEDVDVLEVA